VRRGLAAAVALVAVVLLVYFFLMRERSVAPAVSSPAAAAVLGEGDDAVVVSSKGAVVRWLPVPEEGTLPQLPATEPPPKGRFSGPMREQARVLGAVPDQLRPYVARSFYGSDGVDVELTTGIELRFGDATQASRKWRAAAAVLADPSITALDYVDLQAPSRPAIYGEGHLLPPVE
jgi:cell division septal protein FtsQ